MQYTDEKPPQPDSRDGTPFASEESDAASVSTNEGDLSKKDDGAAEYTALTAEDEVINWSIALQPRNLFKLVTSEDKFNVHKILGVICLTHYIFRFMSLLVTGSMGFEHHSVPKILLFLGFHALLSWSSLIFHLPPRKNRVKPMIWPELRVHNIVFATRSILDAVTNVVLEDKLTRRLICFTIAVVTMIVADIVSEHYRKLQLITQQDSTMRAMPWPNDASPKLISRINLYYALSQLFATAGVINVSRKWTTDVELALTTLFAIQLSALLMTLVRKSILGSYAWHFWYQISLGLSWVLLLYRYSERSPLPFVAFRLCIGCFIGYYLRFHINMNKYVMWAIFAVADGAVLDAIRHLNIDLLPLKEFFPSYF